jgi:hypothetical protein
MRKLTTADFPEGAHFYHDSDCTREVNDFDDYPVEDDDGTELRVYDGDGNPIDREEPIVNRDRPLGILLNLQKTPSLFRQEKEDLFTHVELENYDDAARSAIIGRHRQYTYPLAYTKYAGNLQSGRPPDHMYTVQDAMNDELTEEGEHRRQAIQLTNCSFYNESSHQFRDSTKNHECTRGYMTAASIGQGLNNATHRQQFLRVHREINPLLPYERFDQKIETVGEYVGMRLEQNYVMDIEEFPENKQNGR